MNKAESSGRPFDEWAAERVGITPQELVEVRKTTVIALSMATQLLGQEGAIGSMDMQLILGAELHKRSQEYKKTL